MNGAIVALHAVMVSDSELQQFAYPQLLFVKGLPLLKNRVIEEHVLITLKVFQACGIGTNGVTVQFRVVEE